MIANNTVLSENLSITESRKAPMGLAVLFLLAKDPSRASKREKNKNRDEPIIQISQYIKIDARRVPRNAVMVNWEAEKRCLIKKSTKGIEIFSKGPLR